ncbi:MAG: DNA adenine methylase [Oscillibacter sp.]|nr:DNA adenine methylase [Oscillibacter sp.]
MHAVLKYPGAKWSLAEWIISHFPPHHSYLEPFFGSGAVLFNKPRSNIETVNDLDGDVVNLFEWIRKDPERLAEEIYWIPYARDVFDKAWDQRYAEMNSFQRAVNFYIRMMMGYGFRVSGAKVGWKKDVQGREAAYAANMWCKAPEKIRASAERLRGVQIENKPAVELIRAFNFPNVLIYCDPPYVLSARSGEKRQYKHEMTDADHSELLDVLKAHRGPVLISGYPSELYDRELRGWYRETTTATDQLSRRRQEVLWMNFEPERQQETLFTEEVEP